MSGAQIMTRAIVLAALLVLGACADTRTLEELEQEAMETGDWSAVERREKKLAEQLARREAGCRTTETLVCETLAGASKCYCVSKHDRIWDY